MSKANILVVDDQDSIRHFVSKALEDGRLHGPDHRLGARDRARRSSATCRTSLLLDLKLPDGTGIELLREIKRAAARGADHPR